MATPIPPAIYSDIDIELNRQTDGDVTRHMEFDAVLNSLTNIINTLQGSRRMLPDFASDIFQLVFDPIDDITAQLIGERVIENIEFWEDRVDILGLDIEPRYDASEYRCRLDVKIKTTGDVQSISFILK